MLLQSVYNKIVFLIGYLRGRFWSLFFWSMWNKTYIMKSCMFYSPRWIHIWDRGFVNFSCIIDGKGGVFIGDDVSFGPNVSIWTFNHRSESKKIPINQQGNIMKSVYIWSDVWIGGGAIILPWVKIGQGSVVWAWSVVTKDIWDYEVRAGNPAKFIKKR